MTEQEIAVKLTEHEGKIERHEGRIKTLESNYTALNDLARTTAVMAEKIDVTEKKVDSISSNVEELMLKGSKRWDGIVEKVIFAVVGAMIAYLLARAGL